MKTRGLIMILGLLGGSMLLLLVPWVLGYPDAVAKPVVPGVMAAPQGEAAHLEKIAAPLSYDPPDEVICTLAYTTTDASPTTNVAFDDAASIGNYTDQVLLQGSGPYAVGQQVAAKVDFYRLDNAQPYYKYTIRAVPDRTNNYDLGIRIYDKTKQLIVTDVDPTTNFAEATFQVGGAYGDFYFIEVFQRGAQCTGGTYYIQLTSVAPTATPTPTGTPGPTSTSTPKPASTATPAPTWISGYDQYEPNFSFETAKVIGPGVTYNLNFIPWGGGSEVDNDYFKLWVKPGLFFECETYDLAPGVDTNMILYDANRTAIMGNDDRELGDYSSRVSYYSNFEGFLYLLVGTGQRLSLPDAINSSYSLQCTKSVPGTEGGAGDKGTTPMPTATPRSSTTSPLDTPEAPTATPRPSASTVELSFRALTTPPPTTPTPTPGGFRTFRVMIYYDVNSDGQFGAGEGIPGFFIRILDASSGEELAHGYTDEQGQLSFTVPTVGTVRALVPLLGIDRFVEPTTPEFKVRVAPQPLPDAIP